MNHDYKYENLREEDRNALISAIRRTSERERLLAKVHASRNRSPEAREWGGLEMPEARE